MTTNGSTNGIASSAAIRNPAEHATSAAPQPEAAQAAFTSHLERVPTLFSGAPEDRYEPFPITSIQEAYWVGATSAFDLGGQCCQALFEMESEGLDLARLQQAWTRMLERHPMLRATIRADGQQVIRRMSEVDGELPIIDLRDSGVDLEDHLQELRSKLEMREASSGRLTALILSVALIPGNLQRVYFSWDFAFCDFSSIWLLGPELRTLYADPNAELRETAIEFRDYIQASETIGGGAREEALLYWEEKAQTLPPSPQLPRLPRRREAKAKPLQRRAVVDPEHWSSIKKRAVELGLSRTGVIISAFSYALAPWSTQPRFSLNLTICRRPPVHPDLFHVVGDFTEVSLLEVDASEDPTFTEHACRVQKRFRADIAHSGVCGIEVNRMAGSAQGHDRSSAGVVFTSLLSPIEGETPGLEGMLGWLGRHVYESTSTPQVALDHQALEQADGRLELRWDFQDDVFPEGVVDAMFADYLELLENLALSPSAWEARRGRAPEPPTEALPKEPALLQAFFERRVREASGASAVITDERTLDYQEVEARSNELATRLRELGAMPNTLVAISMERGWEQVVAVLAILKAGAAYVPIDPHLPPQRLALLLERGDVDLVLTQKHLEQGLAWPGGVTLIAVDSSDYDRAAACPEVIQKASDLAYVIYTSGSTGEPKGVMIDHRGALNTVLALNERLEMSARSRVLAISSLSFDLSVYDVFGPLCAGGAVVVPPSGSERDPKTWQQMILDHEITVWNSVPALFELLVELEEEGDEGAIEGLETVLLSGDWIPVGLPDRIRCLNAGGQLLSLGGATEASIWSIGYSIGRVDPEWQSIPYGTALTGQSVAVLSDRLDPCPPWVTGEICIGGVGVAKGYWRDPERSADSFVTHPITGETLYRTGDLGRLRPDGNIELLGRCDLQVKVRGYRVELGEIESTALRHPGVSAVAIVAQSREGDPQNKQLVAFVVPNDRSEVERVATSEAEAAARSPELDVAAFSDLPADSETRGIVITDPIERIEFKADRRGIRREGLGPAAQLSTLRPAAPFLVESRTRRTTRRFSEAAVSADQIGALLACLRQVEFDDEAFAKAAYPSAGDLYPVQAYVFAAAGRVDGLEKGGFYYYDPTAHELRALSGDSELASAVHGANNVQAFEQSAFSLFLVASASAIQPIYGDLSRDFCLLEAGYMSQLLMAAATPLELGMCPIGAVNFDAIRPHLGLRDDAMLLHSHVCGAPEAETESQAGSRTLPALGASLEVGVRVLLAESLPDYMVPSRVVMVDALPLSSNGKVDRGKLLEMEAQAPRAPYVAPRGEVEELLGRLVQEVIGLERISVHESFFDLGATSLDLVRIHRKMQASIDSRISVVKLFQYPTVHSLAESLGPVEAGSEKQSVRERALERASRRRVRRA